MQQRPDILMDDDQFTKSAVPNGQCIGIDVVHLLRKLEYWPIVEVLPQDYLNAVINAIDMLTEMGKRVIAVFDGLLDYSRFQRPVFDERPASDEITPRKLKNQFPRASMTGASEETLNALFMALVEHYRGSQQVMVMRAPYFAWAQLATFLHEGQIGDIIGPLEMFIFPNVRRVLLSFLDHTSLSLAEEKDIQQIFSSDARAGVLIRRYSSHDYVRNSFALFSPVYSMASGQINLTRVDTLIPDLRTEPLPNLSDLNTFYGKDIWRANPELIVHMSSGMLPVPVVRAIVYGERSADPNSGPTLHLPIVPNFPAEPQPNGSGVVFERFRMSINFMHPLLVQIVYQVIDCFRSERNVPSTDSRPPKIELDEWDLVGWESHHLPFWLTYLELTGVRARSTATYESSVAAHFAIRMKVLDLMGYFTHAMSSDVPDDSGLSSFAWALKKCDYKNACAGVLFIESCRTCMLNGEDFLHREGDVVNSHAMLGARIMSLMRLRRQKKDQQLQPWCMNIIAFNNIVRISFNVLQQLNLVMAFNTLNAPSFQYNNDDLTAAEVYQQLIFKEAPTPHMGFVAYAIFSSDEPTSIDKLRRNFSDASHLVEDLTAAVEFFKSAVDMAEAMRGEDSGISSKCLDDIRDAYDYCSQKLSHIPELKDLV